MAICRIWMDLENIMLSEIRQRKRILYDVTYKWNLKNSTHKFVCKTETDSQT